MAPPTHRQLLHRLRQLSLALLTRWPLQVASLKLINHGENTIYEVRATDAQRYILRLHRPGYQSDAAIASELDWLQALRQDTRLRVPEALPGHDGAWIQTLSTPQLPGGRRSVLFRRQPGSLVGRRLSVKTCTQLGALLARLHQHAQHYTPARPIARARLDVEGWTGPQAIFGDPTAVPGLSPTAREHLTRVRARFTDRLTEYGQGAARFGLIHSDLHMHNVLRHEGALIPIDFDDSAQSYYMTDLVIPMRSWRHHKRYKTWRQALWDGYESVRPMTDQDRAILPDLSIMSMMVGVAWLHSRRDLPGMGERLRGWLKTMEVAGAAYLRGEDPLLADLTAP